ncbi:MAG: CvpA family protein [Clostridia bacterium]|nr:CvpA family protein [Clostridia bacterium]
MNIIDYIIIAVFAFGILSGMHKGFLASGLSTLGFAASWFGAQALYEKIANFALSNSTLMAVLNQYLEPDDFFANFQQANTAITTVLAGGESAISELVNQVGANFSFIGNAFSANIRMQAFEKLGLNTVSQYFNQTLWVAVFNVMAFLAAFIVLYAVANLIVNLIDHVVCLPILRGADWLVGGVFGFLRASVVVVIILIIMPMLLNFIDPALTESLKKGSALFSFASQLDILNVGNWLNTLMMG